MENILEQAKKVAEEAEVFMVSSEETPVQFEANRLKHIQNKRSSSVALRIVRQGKIGYATTTEMDDSQNLVNNAVETAQFGMTAKFELPSLTAYAQVEAYDNHGQGAYPRYSMRGRGNQGCSLSSYYKFSWWAGELQEKHLQPGY